MPTVRRGACALLVVGLLAVPGLAAAQPAVELERARERAADLDGQVERAEGRVEEARAAVADLEQQLRAAGRELSAAEAEQAEAEASAELARRRTQRALAELRAVEVEVDENQQSLAAFARETYKHGVSSASPTVMALRSLTGGDGATELADSLQGMRHGLRSQRRVVEEAQVLRIRAEVLADTAAAEEAEERRFLAEAVAASGRAAEAHARVQQLVADASAAEALRADRLAELEDARRAVGGEIADLEEQVARERAEREAREREAREQAAREQAAREQAERERAEREARERQARQRAAPAPSPAPAPSGGGGSTNVSTGPRPGLVTVGGITVAESLGPSLQALLDHARSDGIVLGGSGYRSPDAQVALRRANGCPDVWTSPASSCRVPTAIPGSSEHEKGLAVDFTYQGRTICYPSSASRCTGNRAFEWLRANAGRYGLRNLPSEAWHWSTTGR